MKRKRTFQIAAAVAAFLSSAAGGAAMIERGSVRPGVLLICAGVVMAVVTVHKALRREPQDPPTT